MVNAIRKLVDRYRTPKMIPASAEIMTNISSFFTFANTVMKIQKTKKTQTHSLNVALIFLVLTGTRLSLK